VGFQVLMAAIMKITAFWDITPCRLVEVDGGSKHSEMLVYFYKTTNAISQKSVMV
jgi:hypothetical protein